MQNRAENLSHWQWCGAMIRPCYTSRRNAPKYSAGEAISGRKEAGAAHARRIERAMNAHPFAAHCAEVLPHCAEHAETMRQDDIETTLQGMISDLETMHETTDRKPCVTHCGTDARDSAKGMAMNTTEELERVLIEASLCIGTVADCGGAFTYFLAERLQGVGIEDIDLNGMTVGELRRAITAAKKHFNRKDKRGEA